jgi:hypothetical protein
MRLAYEDALQQVLESLQAGEEIESAVERHPDHATALRQDARFAQALAASAEVIPAPPPPVRAGAQRRLQAQLEVERSRIPSATRGSALKTPRLAMAGIVVAVVAVLGALIVLDGSGTAVEAATIEGVVVENEGGRLTVQTLDALELVSVPADTPVSDVAGSPLSLDVVVVGQVVVIDVERRGNDVVARRIERYEESIEAWCRDDSQRCRALSESLERARQQCGLSARACLAAVGKLETLRARAATAARLEELKQACRGGAADACRQLLAFCRDHSDVCHDFVPVLPPLDGPKVADRLRELDEDCTTGDEGACRRLSEVCDAYPAYCASDVPSRPAGAEPTPEATPQPEATTAPDVRSMPDVAPSPDVSPSEAPSLDAPRPVQTSEPAGDSRPSPWLQPADDATPAPVRDAQPEPTLPSGQAEPVPDAKPTEADDGARDGDVSAGRR